jgi:imidazole glycerol-phosphate synthase subunit HisH
MKIAIIDYGAGNLRSVANTLEEIGANYRVLTTPEGIETFDKIILPGVGHFGQMMRALDERMLRPAVLERIHAGVTLLGICIGLQCMFDGSEEAPDQQGLHLFPGTVTRFPKDARVPHMGWNSLDRVKDCKLLEGLGEHPYVYFAHSYHAPLCDATAATCTYGYPYTAALQRDNVYAVMRNFVELC